jgi:hypothetical protein
LVYLQQEVNLTRPRVHLAFGCKLVVRLVQHARAGEIEIWRCRKIADNQADVGGGRGTQPAQHPLQDGVGIDIEERRFGTEGDYARQRLVLGMAGEVGVSVGAGNPSEERHVRT